MGLCYSLRPLLFGVSEDTPSADSETPGEDARPGPVTALTSAPAARGYVDLTPVPAGASWSPARSLPRSDGKKEKGRRPEHLRAEEREAERQARKVSRNIDRMLREQKRDLQQTHRLLLLGRCRRSACCPEGEGFSPQGGWGGGVATVTCSLSSTGLPFCAIC